MLKRMRSYFQSQLPQLTEDIQKFSDPAGNSETARLRSALALSNLLAAFEEASLKGQLKYDVLKTMCIVCFKDVLAYSDTGYSLATVTQYKYSETLFFLDMLLLSQCLAAPTVRLFPGPK